MILTNAPYIGAETINGVYCCIKLFNTERILTNHQVLDTSIERICKIRTII